MNIQHRYYYVVPLDKLNGLRRREEEIGFNSLMTPYERNNARESVKAQRQGMYSQVVNALDWDWKTLKQEYQELKREKTAAADRSTQQTSSPRARVSVPSAGFSERVRLGGAIVLDLPTLPGGRCPNRNRTISAARPAVYAISTVDPPNVRIRVTRLDSAVRSPVRRLILGDRASPDQVSGLDECENPERKAAGRP